MTDPLKGECWMDPSTIKFSTGYISSKFSRTPLQKGAGGRFYSESLKKSPHFSLEETLQDLRDGKLKVRDIPRIHVVKHDLDGHYYSLNNRRLWVFKEFGHSIPVIIQQTPTGLFENLARQQVGHTVTLIADPHMEPIDHKADDTCKAFLDVVLRWSTRDIRNERLYIDNVKEISTTFADVKAYHKAFLWPLLEETRAQALSGLEDIGLAPYISVSSVESYPKDGVQCYKFTMGTYFDRGQKEDPWKPKSNDLVVLCTSAPRNLKDLLVHGEDYTIALISWSDESRQSFGVTACVPLRETSNRSKPLKGKRSCDWYAVHLDSLVTGMRIWAALNPDVDLERPVEEDNLCRQLQVSRQSWIHSELTSRHSWEGIIEAYCRYRGLNSAQTAATKATAMGLLNGCGLRTTLVQGPPGTGKTSTLVTFLSIICCLKYRVIVCAPTNRAVAEISERFVKTLENVPGHFASQQFSEFASSSIELRYCRPLEMGDVVMVGNEDKVDTEGILGKIFLPVRTERLLRALAPFSGWRHSAELVLNFLKDPLEEFKQYNALWHENNKDVKKTPLLNFLQFTRTKMNVPGREMTDCGRIMCNDLPSKVLSVDTKKIIKSSCDVLEKLLELLSNKGMTSKQVRRCFTGDHKSVRSSRNALMKAIDKFLLIMGSKPGYVLNYCKDLPARGSLTEVGVQRMCLAHARLMFSTTCSAGRASVKFSGPFDYAVIDEAAQLVEAEAAIVTQLKGLKQLLLVGDPNQLQAMVRSQASKTCMYGRSLFERLQKLGHPCHILNVQYRMHPAISSFPNKHFYNGVIDDGPNVQAKTYRKSFQDCFGPYAFIDVKDGQETRGNDAARTSWKNPVETLVVEHIIKKLSGEKFSNPSVGVISPYKGQVQSMKKRMNTSVLPHVDFKTVDGFQGGERDIILLSTVRANVHGNIGFLNDFRRLNVALTRGRYAVWVIGNASTLAAKDGMWKALIDDAKGRCCYRDARNEEGLKGVLRTVSPRPGGQNLQTSSKDKQLEEDLPDMQAKPVGIHLAEKQQSLQDIFSSRNSRKPCKEQLGLEIQTSLHTDQTLSEDHGVGRATTWTELRKQRERLPVKQIRNPVQRNEEEPEIHGQNQTPGLDSTENPAEECATEKFGAKGEIRNSKARKKNAKKKSKTMCTQAKHAECQCLVLTTQLAKINLEEERQQLPNIEFDENFVCKPPKETLRLTAVSNTGEAQGDNLGTRGMSCSEWTKESEDPPVRQKWRPLEKPEVMGDTQTSRALCSENDLKERNSAKSEVARGIPTTTGKAKTKNRSKVRNKKIQAEDHIGTSSSRGKVENPVTKKKYKKRQSRAAVALSSSWQAKGVNKRKDPYVKKRQLKIAEEVLNSSEEAQN